MAVRGDVPRVPACGVVHELAVLRAQALQTALDDMVTIQVPDERDHAAPQGVDHQPHLQAWPECQETGATFLRTFGDAPLQTKILAASTWQTALDDMVPVEVPDERVQADPRGIYHQPHQQPWPDYQTMVADFLGTSGHAPLQPKMLAAIADVPQACITSGKVWMSCATQSHCLLTHSLGDLQELTHVRRNLQ